MKAPDKIFIHIKDKPLEITWSEVKEAHCENVEYIRKDALLEWINKNKKYTSGPSWFLLKTHIETI